MKTTRTLMLFATVALATLGAANGPVNAADKFSIAVPGVPPVFSTVMIYVAKEGGFYKKHGLDVTIRPFRSGVAAAKAVLSGAVDASLSPTAPVVRMVSNAGVPLVGLQGLEKPDWFLGSMDPMKNKCTDLKGQAVGVDSPRGARWIQLQNMSRSCKLFPDRQIPTVNLSSNVGAAMVAGQINFGVLHLDDIPVIERESGKKLTVVMQIEKTAPGTHYLMYVTLKKTLAAKRDILVRSVAAQIEAIDFMYNPANRAKVAAYAKATKRKIGDATSAVKVFTDFNYWPRGTNGLNKKRIARTVKIQAIVGKKTKGKSGIKPGKKPVSFDQLTDISVWADAAKIAGK
jgi:ABC-type nitrate/sulfonate/bicarbonate transport system substrate-binding protein